MKPLTLEEVIERVNKIHNGCIVYVEGYKNTHTKCKWLCIECGRIFSATPNGLMQGRGCKVCSDKKRGIKYATKIEDMLLQLKEVWGDLIEYVSDYQKMNAKCKWRCAICGHEWDSLPTNVINHKHGCPICAKKRRAKKQMIPLEEFLRRLKEVWGDLIKYVEGYKGTGANCKFKCTVCGYEWEARPVDILKGDGCIKCAIKRNAENKTIPLEEFLRRLKEIWGDLIEYVSGYKGTSKKCRFRCKICGCVWETIPIYLLNGTGCPLCLKNSMERPVLEALNKKGIIPIHNEGLKGCYYKNSTRPLRPDFRIETNKGKLAIETDGRQHFEPLFGNKQKLKFQQEKDRYKDKILKERGYILIRVTSSPTKEWGFENHITLAELLHLIEIGIDSKTGKIDFVLFKQYDFNRE